MAKSLEQFRKDLHLSRYSLAKELNVTPNSIVNWEHGKSMPSAEAVYDMSKFFGVTTDDIFLALKTTNVVENKN